MNEEKQNGNLNENAAPNEIDTTDSAPDEATATTAPQPEKSHPQCSSDTAFAVATKAGSPAVDAIDDATSNAQAADESADAVQIDPQAADEGADAVQIDPQAADESADAAQTESLTTSEDKPTARDADAYDPEHPRIADTVFDFMELFMIALTAILLITTFLFRHSIVDGGSMEATLHDGDHLILLSAFYTPQVGDIVVCEDHSLNPHLRKPLVKRIIATEGQTVRIEDDSEVYVDGVRLQEEYVMLDGASSYSYPIEYTVSPGCVFVMGDHRNNSADSRLFGEIATECILGKALLRFYPISNFALLD